MKRPPLTPLDIAAVLPAFEAKLSLEQLAHRLGHYALDCAARALPHIRPFADNARHRTLLQLCRRWLRSQASLDDVIALQAALPVMPYDPSWRRSTALFAELALRAFEPRDGAARRATQAGTYSALAGWAAAGGDDTPSDNSAFDAELDWQAARLRSRLTHHDLADWPDSPEILE